MILRQLPAFRRALALLAVSALAFGFLVTAGAPASAASLSTSGTITSSDPTYRQVNPGAFCDHLAGEPTHYDVVAMTVGANADSTLSITVNPTGFRAAVSIYQVAFLAANPQADCFVQPKIGATTGSPVSFSLPLTKAPDGFPTQAYFVVITTDDLSSPGGAWSMTANSSATSIELQESPPQPETALVSSIKRSDPSPTNASELGFDVTFDKAVGGVDASNFRLTAGGTAAATRPVDVTGSGNKRHVTATVIGDGNVRLDFVNSNGITPTVTNTLQGESYALDNTAPVVNVPPHQFLDATGPDGALTTLATVTATDAGDPAVETVCSPVHDTFPLGDTLVTCTATDTAGNTGSASFTVTVADHGKPTVTVPGNQTIEATGPDGASFSPVDATATDAVDGALTPVCNDLPSPLTIGEHTIRCVATDKAGNEGEASYTITVADSTKPTVTAPEDQTVEATGPDGASVTPGTATATDLVDGTLVPACDDLADPLPLGEHTIHCTATDHAGNKGEASYTITVADTTKPALAVPADQAVEATGPDGATVTPGTVTATDTVDGTLVPACDDVPDPLPLGEHTIHCTATDHAGNKGEASYTITVADTTAPTVTPPESQTVEATGPDGASVTPGEATATDIVDGDLTPVCDDVPDPLAVGEHTIVCRVTDAAGNEGRAEYTLRVADTTKPALTLPDGVTATATGPDGAKVTFEATASDVVAGAVPVTCEPASGSLFPVGVTTVTCTASDAGAPTAPETTTPTERRPAVAEDADDASVANEATGTFEVTILPMPATPTATDPGSGGSSSAAAGGSGGGLPVTGAAGAGIAAAGGLGLLALGAALLGMRRRQQH